jgi:hypothetical protein
MKYLKHGKSNDTFFGQQLERGQRTVRLPLFFLNILAGDSQEADEADDYKQ